MIRLNSVETEKVQLEVVECNCGYHMTADFTYIDQVKDFDLVCPACNDKINTKELKDLVQHIKTIVVNRREYEIFKDPESSTGNYWAMRCSGSRSQLFAELEYLENALSKEEVDWN